MLKIYIHEGVRYPCSKCDYIATLVGALKTYVKNTHERVRYHYSQCDYAATQESILKNMLKLNIKE